MIRVVLLGRTGNILFQYALGRALSARHGVPLVLDASWYNAAGWAEVRHFLRLPIRAKVVRRASLAARALRNYTGRHYWEYRGVPMLKEDPRDQSFDPRFLSAPADCILFGYFQTARYFESIADELRHEFNDLIQRGAHASRARSSASCVRDLNTTLIEPTSVAVHVRRTDFLRHAAFRVCGPDYYRRAMDTMRARVAGARFFIFSDDAEWCRKEFSSSDTEVVSAVMANPLHDLHRMSLASHHILANSSYSWWAAWLGDKPGQQVIMPDRWYLEGGPHAPIEEKALKHWIRIEA